MLSQYPIMQQLSYRFTMFCFLNVLLCCVSTDEFLNSEQDMKHIRKKIEEVEGKSQSFNPLTVRKPHIRQVISRELSATNFVAGESLNGRLQGCGKFHVSVIYLLTFVLTSLPQTERELIKSTLASCTLLTEMFKEQQLLVQRPLM